MKKKIILGLVILCIFPLITACNDVESMMKSNGESNQSSIRHNNSEFAVTDEKEEQATKWIKDNVYENKFDHSDNTETIKCYTEDIRETIDGMLPCIMLNFNTKDTNDSEYPYELIDPKYELYILVDNTYQIISKVIIQTDNKRMELNNEHTQVEILNDEDTTGFISEISIDQMENIANSKTLSITMYNDKGEKMHSSNSEEQLSNLKKQIKVAGTFYSLKGTTWNLGD